MARSWRARRETSIPARLGFSSRIAHTGHAARHRSPIYRVGAEAPLPLIPAHSASLRAFTPVFDGLWTRVNPLMLGTHIPEAVVMGPRFRGDDSKSVGFGNRLDPAMAARRCRRSAAAARRSWWGR